MLEKKNMTNETSQGVFPKIWNLETKIYWTFNNFSLNFRKAAVKGVQNIETQNEVGSIPLPFICTFP